MTRQQEQLQALRQQQQLQAQERWWQEEYEKERLSRQQQQQERQQQQEWQQQQQEWQQQVLAARLQPARSPALQPPGLGLPPQQAWQLPGAPSPLGSRQGSGSGALPSDLDALLITQPNPNQQQQLLQRQSSLASGSPAASPAVGRSFSGLPPAGPLSPAAAGAPQAFPLPPAQLPRQGSHPVPGLLPPVVPLLGAPAQHRQQQQQQQQHQTEAASQFVSVVCGAAKGSLALRTGEVVCHCPPCAERHTATSRPVLFSLPAFERHSGTGGGEGWARSILAQLPGRGEVELAAWLAANGLVALQRGEGVWFARANGTVGGAAGAAPQQAASGGALGRAGSGGGGSGNGFAGALPPPRPLVVQRQSSLQLPSPLSPPAPTLSNPFIQHAPAFTPAATMPLALQDAAALMAPPQARQRPPDGRPGPPPFPQRAGSGVLQPPPPFTLPPVSPPPALQQQQPNQPHLQPPPPPAAAGGETVVVQGDGYQVG
jgi:hypothetical protein